MHKVVRYTATCKLPTVNVGTEAGISEVSIQKTNELSIISYLSYRSMSNIFFHPFKSLE